MNESYKSYLPPYCREVKGFKNSNKFQLERGIYHCEIVCGNTCTGVCRDLSEHQVGLDTAADRPSCFPGTCLWCWSMAISIPNPAGIFIP